SVVALLITSVRAIVFIVGMMSATSINKVELRGQGPEGMTASMSHDAGDRTETWPAEGWATFNTEESWAELTLEAPEDVESETVSCQIFWNGEVVVDETSDSGEVTCRYDGASTSTPSPTNTESLYSAADGAESSANSFFSLLAAGDIAPEFVQVEPAVDLDLEKPLSALLTPEVYAQVQDRPKIQSVDDVAASEDGEDATASVTYELAGEELTETLDLRLIAAHDDKPWDYAIVIPKDEFGIDATGVELLPADTEYRIHGVDVSAAFKEARGWSDNGEVPRIPAFGGTYPLEITVPGDNGFTGTLELQASTFYGGDGTDGELAAFAHAHGF
ncbi:MAG: hypothetical protein ACTH07_08680, partial [Microbacterium sp.]